MTLIYKILVYIMEGIIIYLLLRYVPKNKLSEYDAIMTSLIVMIAYIILENLCSFFNVQAEKFNPANPESIITALKCTGNLCAKGIENMSSTPEIKQESETKHKMTSEVTQEIKQEQKSKPETKQEQKSKPETKQVQKGKQDFEQGYDQGYENGYEQGFNQGYGIVPGPKYKGGNTPPPKEESKTCGIQSLGCREKDGIIENELGYTDYNHIPLAEGYSNNDYEYGYSFLPPDKWYPQPPFPPVCVTEKKCPVCPVYTTGTPVDVKEWNSSRRITQPDRINVKYVEEKLNAGR